MTTRYDIISGDTPVECRETTEERDAREGRERQHRAVFESKAYDTAFEVKQRLNKAFRELRKVGFIARQNFQCCNSCAGSCLTNDVTEKFDDGKLKPTFKGVVYTTRQDQMFEKENGWSRRLKIRRVFLKYGPVDLGKRGEQGAATKECAKLVVAALTAAGVPFSWNGKAANCIVVEPLQGLLADPAYTTVLHEYEREQKTVSVRN